MTAPAQQEPKRERKLLEIVDPSTNKAIEVVPIQPPAPVVPAAPVVPLGPDDEKKKLDVARELSEQVRKRINSTTVDDSAPAKSPNAQQQVAPVPVGAGLPNFSVPPPIISAQPASPAPQAPPTPATPEAPSTKVEAPATQPDILTPVSSPQTSDTTNTTPASGTAESAASGRGDRVTPSLQKEESKEEVDDDKFDENERVDTPELTESQIEKTPEELEEEKAQKEAEEKEKRRQKEESLERKITQLVESGAASDGCFTREFMVTIREIEKHFTRTPCPLSPSQLADFGLDIKSMRVTENNKKANFTPQWMQNNKGPRQQNNPYRGRTTTDGTGRGAQQQRDRGGHNKRPPVVRASIERVPRVTLASSKDAWKPDRQKAADNIPEDEAAIREVCKKVRALMNKVTPTSQIPLTQEFISYQVSTNETQLAQVVEIVFDKAVEEPKFCALYAEMCKAQVNHELNKISGKSAFRNTILTRTQMFFQDKRDIDADKLAVIEKEEDPIKREAMLIEEKQKFRRRKFGVMAFIGHLYRNTLLSTKIVQACSFDLFASILPKKDDNDKDLPLKKEDIDEESIHCGLQLVETVGIMLDKSKDIGPGFLDQWFHKLDAAKPVCSNKIRFMIMNLIELRNDKWIPRKSIESGPKKIDEIHKDIRQEKIENEKARDQYDRDRDRDRDRRHGGGVRPNSNSLRKLAPVSRNSLDKNRAPDQKRAQAAANTKLASSNVAPKSISLSSAMESNSLGKSKPSWSTGATGGGNEGAAAPAPAKSAWGRRDSDQRKKSAVDEKQAALATAKEFGSMQISARRSTSQTSIPDKVEEELTDEEKALRAKIMNTIKSDIQEVVSGDLPMADFTFNDFVAKEKYGNPSLTVVYEMTIRAVSEKALKEEERKKLAAILRMSLVSDSEKKAFIDGVTRFCKFAVDVELHQDFPQVWSVTGEVLMNTMHVHHEVIADVNVKTISLAEMKSVFLTARVERKDRKTFDLFVEVIKRWTEAEIEETGEVNALNWEIQDLPYREEMEKDGLREELDSVKASNGKTLSSLLLKS